MFIAARKFFWFGMIYLHTALLGVHIISVRTQMWANV